MPQSFNVVRKTENGQILSIGARESSEEARQLAAEFNVHWPGEYGIQAEGEDSSSIQWLSWSA